MQLHLRVRRYQRAVPQHPMSAVFDVSGGLIGRSAACDWQLPDPHRYVSGSHARIAFDGDNFTLTDVSSNGIFLNGAKTPIGTQATVALAHGDSLSIGEYQIDAEVSGGDALARDEHDHEALNDDTFTQLDAELASPNAIDAPEREDLTAFFGSPADSDNTSGSTINESPDSVQDIAQHMARAAAAPHGVQPPGAVPADAGQPDATTTLLMAMDLDRAMADCRATPVELLQRIGQLLEAMSGGYSELMRSRAARKDSIGAARPMPWQTRSPLEDRSLVGAERVAALLMGDDAVQLVRECVRDLDAHERATTVATEAALRALAGRYKGTQDDIDKAVEEALRGAFARAYESEEQNLRPFANESAHATEPEPLTKEARLGSSARD